MVNTYPPVVSDKNCDARAIIDLVADKWTVLVIRVLLGHVRRYGEIHRAVDGISQKMLTQTLRKLESFGMVKRKIYPVVPPHVEYALTPLGESLREALAGLCDWAGSHMSEVNEAKERYVRERSTIPDATDSY